MVDRSTYVVVLLQLKGVQIVCNNALIFFGIGPVLYFGMIKSISHWFGKIIKKNLCRCSISVFVRVFIFFLTNDPL